MMRRVTIAALASLTFAGCGNEARNDPTGPGQENDVLLAVVAEAPVPADPPRERWLITVDSGPLQGEVTLERMPGASRDWSLIYRRLRRRRRAAGAIC